MKKKKLLPDALSGKPIDHSRHKVNPSCMNLSFISKRSGSRDSLSKHLQKTTKYLKSAKKEISTMVKDVEVLEKRAIIAEKISSLSAQQIQAVQSFSKEISEKREWLRFWLCVLINLVLNIITIVITKVM